MHKLAALFALLASPALATGLEIQIEGEGAVMVDESGVRAGDDEAACTLSADAETFEAILDGDLNPTAAFMSGKLTVDGDMGQAMKLGAVLS